MTSGRDPRRAGEDTAEDKIDTASEDSFPASDPPSYSGVTGDGHPGRKKTGREAEAKPTGTPTSDRHATETTHQREDQEHPHSPTSGRG